MFRSSRATADKGKVVKEKEPAPDPQEESGQGHWTLSSRQNLNAEARQHIENSEELFQASLDAKNIEITQLTHDLKKSKQQVCEEVEHVERLSQKICKLEESLALKTAEGSRLEERNAQLASELEQTESVLKSFLEQENGRRTAERTVEAEQVKTMRTELEVSQSRLAAIEQELSIRDRMIQALKTIIQTECEMHDGRQASCGDRETMLEKRAHTSEESLAVARKTIEMLVADLQRKEAAIGWSTQRFDSKTAEVEQARSQLGAMKGPFKVLEDKARQLEGQLLKERELRQTEHAQFSARITALSKSRSAEVQREVVANAASTPHKDLSSPPPPLPDSASTTAADNDQTASGTSPAQTSPPQKDLTAAPPAPPAETKADGAKAEGGKTDSVKKARRKSGDKKGTPRRGSKEGTPEQTPSPAVTSPRADAQNTQE